MPPKGSGRGRGRGRGKAQAPTRVATTRTTRASAASTTSAEVDDTVALNSATVQPTLAANSVTVSSKPKKGLKTKSADSHPSVALVPTEQGNQTNPKKPRAKKAADPEDLNQQPGDTKQQSAKLDGRKRAGTATASKAPSAKKKKDDNNAGKTKMAPSRPVLDDDNQDDDILSLSDDEEQDDKADEALSGDDELGELRPIELANRLAQERVIWPGDSESVAPSFGDESDREHRHQLPSAPRPLPQDRVGKSQAPKSQIAQGGIRFERAMAEVPSWPAQPEINAEDLQAETGSEDIKPLIEDMPTFDSRTDLVPKHGTCNMLQQQPDIRDLLKRSVNRYNSNIVFENAFPTSTGRSRMAKDAVVYILQDVQPEDFSSAMQKRIETDHMYLNRLVSMISGRDSNLKTKFKDAAYTRVCKGYELENGCQAKITKLLDQQQYIYPNSETGNPRRTEPYRHPTVISLLSYWFDMKNSALHEYKASLISSKDGKLSLIPVPLLALVGTMIHFILLEWQAAGGNDPTVKAAFSGKVVEDAYRTHLGLVRGLRSKHEGKYERMMTRVFEAASTFSDSKNSDTNSFPEPDALMGMDIDGMEE